MPGPGRVNLLKLVKKSAAPVEALPPSLPVVAVDYDLSQILVDIGACRDECGVRDHDRRYELFELQKKYKNDILSILEQLRRSPLKGPLFRDGDCSICDTALEIQKRLDMRRIQKAAGELLPVTFSGDSIPSGDGGAKPQKLRSSLDGLPTQKKTPLLLTRDGLQTQFSAESRPLAEIDPDLVYFVLPDLSVKAPLFDAFRERRGIHDFWNGAALPPKSHCSHVLAYTKCALRTFDHLGDAISRLVGQINGDVVSHYVQSDDVDHGSRLNCGGFGSGKNWSVDRGSKSTVVYSRLSIESWDYTNMCSYREEWPDMTRSRIETRLPAICVLHPKIQNSAMCKGQELLTVLDNSSFSLSPEMILEGAQKRDPEIFTARLPRLFLTSHMADHHGTNGITNLAAVTRNTEELLADESAFHLWWVDYCSEHPTAAALWESWCAGLSFAGLNSDSVTSRLMSLSSSLSFNNAQLQASLSPIFDSTITDVFAPEDRIKKIRGKLKDARGWCGLREDPPAGMEFLDGRYYVDRANWPQPKRGPPLTDVQICHQARSKAHVLTKAPGKIAPNKWLCVGMSAARINWIASGWPAMFADWCGKDLHIGQGTRLELSAPPAEHFAFLQATAAYCPYSSPSEHLQKSLLQSRKKNMGKVRDRDEMLTTLIDDMKTQWVEMPKSMMYMTVRLEREADKWDKEMKEELERNPPDADKKKGGEKSAPAPSNPVRKLLPPKEEQRKIHNKVSQGYRLALLTNTATTLYKTSFCRSHVEFMNDWGKAGEEKKKKMLDKLLGLTKSPPPLARTDDEGPIILYNLSILCQRQPPRFRVAFIDLVWSELQYQEKTSANVEREHCELLRSRRAGVMSKLIGACRAASDLIARVIGRAEELAEADYKEILKAEMRKHFAHCHSDLVEKEDAMYDAKGSHIGRSEFAKQKGSSIGAADEPKDKKNYFRRIWDSWGDLSQEEKKTYDDDAAARTVEEVEELWGKGLKQKADDRREGPYKSKKTFLRLPLKEHQVALMDFWRGLQADCVKSWHPADPKGRRGDRQKEQERFEKLTNSMHFDEEYETLTSVSFGSSRLSKSIRFISQKASSKTMWTRCKKKSKAAKLKELGKRTEEEQAGISTVLSDIDPTCTHLVVRLGDGFGVCPSELDEDAMEAGNLQQPAATRGENRAITEKQRRKIPPNEPNGLFILVLFSWGQPFSFVGLLLDCHKEFPKNQIDSVAENNTATHDLFPAIYGLSKAIQGITRSSFTDSDHVGYVKSFTIYQSSLTMLSNGVSVKLISPVEFKEGGLDEGAKTEITRVEGRAVGSSKKGVAKKESGKPGRKIKRVEVESLFEDKSSKRRKTKKENGEDGPKKLPSIFAVSNSACVVSDSSAAASSSAASSSSIAASKSKAKPQASKASGFCAAAPDSGESDFFEDSSENDGGDSDEEADSVSEDNEDDGSEQKGESVDASMSGSFCAADVDGNDRNERAVRMKQHNERLRSLANEKGSASWGDFYKPGSDHIKRNRTRVLVTLEGEIAYKATQLEKQLEKRGWCGAVRTLTKDGATKYRSVKKPTTSAAILYLATWAALQAIKIHNTNKFREMKHPLEFEPVFNIAQRNALRNRLPGFIQSISGMDAFTQQQKAKNLKILLDEIPENWFRAWDTDSWDASVVPMIFESCNAWSDEE